jgi:ABC-2 type transport system permease protein
VARRVLRQFARDKRSVAMLLAVPIAVMTLLSVVVDFDVTEVRTELYAEGSGSVFSSDMVDSLSKHLRISEAYSLEDAQRRLAAGNLDALLVIPSGFLEARVAGRAASMEMHLAGDNPAKNAAILRELKDSMSGVLDGIPALLPESCTDECTTSVNTKFPDLEERFLNGRSDLRLIDFHGSFFATFFVFFFGFIFSSLAFFRERTQGTLERMLVTPLSAVDIFAGYLIAFFVTGMIQATVIILFLVHVLDIYVAGSIALLYLAIVPTVLIAEALGIFVSAFSRREFQVVQFVPVVVLPQVLLSNLFWPVADFPSWLRPFAYVMPVFHADLAARVVLLRGEGIAAMLPSVGVLLAMCACVMGLSAWRIRRQA